MEPTGITDFQGIINLDKPAGLSSARAVGRVKRLIPRGIKIGHAGTLDPFATGVLLLLIGKATRLCERLMDSPKQYEAVVRLGATTPTDDPESQVTETSGAVAPARDAVFAALQGFVGQISQLPPTFSALKVGGRRAYELARKGKPVELQPRIVRVDSIELLDYAWPLLRIRIDCGRGTYIRAIARDLGAGLGVCGHLTELRRTRVGEFWANESTTLESLTRQGVGAHLRSLRELPPSPYNSAMYAPHLIDNYENGAAKVAQIIKGLDREDLFAFPAAGKVVDPAGRDPSGRQRAGFCRSDQARDCRG